MKIGDGKSPRQLTECVGNGAFDEAKSHLIDPQPGIFLLALVNQGGTTSQKPSSLNKE